MGFVVKGLKEESLSVEKIEGQWNEEVAKEVIMAGIRVVGV